MTAWRAGTQRLHLPVTLCTPTPGLCLTQAPSQPATQIATTCDVNQLINGLRSVVGTSPVCMKGDYLFLMLSLLSLLQ